MLSIRLHQRFQCLKFRLNAESLFILMLDSESYFLAINVVGRSCPHRIEKNVSCRTTYQFHVFAKQLLGQFETVAMIRLIYGKL